jgi:hypothetical protein
MVRRRLRAIIACSFGKSEETNFDSAYYSREYHKLIRSMDPNDVICLASIGQNQLQFVHGYIEGKTKGRKSWMVLFSQKMRIKRGPGLADTFEPLMLANYARYVGIELIGIELFEEHFKHLRQEEGGSKKAKKKRTH